MARVSRQAAARRGPAGAPAGLRRVPGIGLCLALCSPPRAAMRPPAAPRRSRRRVAPAGERPALSRRARAAHLPLLLGSRRSRAPASIPDRWPTRSFASVAATGFGLTAYPIGAERGWVTRAEARDRVLATLRFLWRAPQGPEPAGRIGYRGFFYHFLDPATGERFERVELSTVDTALLLAGALFCQSYFDRDDPGEREIRELAESLYLRVEWDWAQPKAPAISHGWHPETGFIASDWRGYNEAMLVYLLALGSPTHAVGPEAWAEWTRPVPGGRRSTASATSTFRRCSATTTRMCGSISAASGTQPMRRLGWDYFENSRRATLAQRAWAIANPRGWSGIDRDIWGVTACDGPADVELAVRGRASAASGPTRGAASGRASRSTTAPSRPPAPAARCRSPRRRRPLRCSRCALAMARNLWSHLRIPRRVQSQLRLSASAGASRQSGARVPAGTTPTTWASTRARSWRWRRTTARDLIWNVMRKNPHLVRGLRRAGFGGGWLDGAAP